MESSDYPIKDGVIRYKNFEVSQISKINLVLELLERQLRMEELTLIANNIERAKRAGLIGYKGPELYPENHEYVEQLKWAIDIIKENSE